jgi:hypothetical protein
MLSTISYYNGISDLHRHECMEGQLDRTSSKDSPISNAGIDLVLEKQKDPIVGLVIEDVFVLPLYCRVIRFHIHVYNFRCKILEYQILNKKL